MPIQLEGPVAAVRSSSRFSRTRPIPTSFATARSVARPPAAAGLPSTSWGRAQPGGDGKRTLRIYRAQICDDAGHCETSTGERHFCARCATALWLFDPQWPELVHPFASAIDTDLPIPPSRVHLMLRDKATWVEPIVGPDDGTFEDLSQPVDRGVASRAVWWID